MFLKNYTSDVPPSETLHAIEKVLIKCGAAGIQKEYAPFPVGTVAAVSFQIETPSGKISIRLPVDINRAHEALWRDYVGDDKTNHNDTEVWSNPRKRKYKKDFTQQAERTAWKITRDWVEVQMSMIQLKQADVLQVFLPYVITGSGQSVYALVQGGGFAGLLPEKTEQ